MTSSAASLTREREVAGVGRGAGARLRITSTPPPPGRCTSSSTTSGLVLVHRGDRLVDVGGLGDDVDDAAPRASSSARTPAPEHRVVVDEHDPRTGAAQLIGCSSCCRGRCSRTSVPSPGAERTSARAAVPRPSGRRCCCGRRTGPRRRRRGRSRAPRSRTNTSTAPAVISAYTSTLPVPACLAALVTASRVAWTIGPQRLVEVAVADGDDVDGRRRAASSTSAATPRRALATRALVGRRRRRTARSAGRAPGRGPAGRRWWPSLAFFWIRASVWSTESCRCAAMSARSWVRTRSARSAPRSDGEPEDPRADDDREPDDGQQRRRPCTSRAIRIDPPRQRRRATSAATIRPTPAATRAYAAQPPLPKTARNGSIRPVVSSQRSRWASSAWRHSSAMPTTPRTTGQKTRALAEHGLEQQDRAEAEGGQRDRRADVASAGGSGPGGGRRGWRSRGRGRSVSKRGVGGQQPPQAGVEDDAEAAEERGEHEAGAHPQHRDAEVSGQARRRRRRGSAPGCRGRRARRPGGPTRRVGGWRSVLLIVAPSSHSGGPRTMRANPGRP